MKKINLFILLSFFNFGLLFSQNEEVSQPKLPQVVPVSPEAASLGKYGDLPVNLSTGKINYTIPIYTIKVGGFELPLTLSYNYGGFMPEEEPSSVGMGWTANFGGAIIRQIKGRADEKSNLGYLALSNYFNDFNNLSLADKELTIKNSGNGFWDSRPDAFIINTPLIDGTFRLKDINTPIFTPYRNHKVSVLNYNTPGYNGFEITDDRGAVYTFDTFEETEQESLDGDVDILEYRSSWMISKINPSNSTDEITFTYGDYHHTITSLSKYRTRRVGLGGGGTCANCDDSSIFQSESETRINAKTLERIDFPNGYIVFDHNIAQNVPGIGVSQYEVLRSISIYNIDNRLIEKYHLGYYELEDYHFLTSIQKESDSGNMLDYYSFDYYKLNEMPLAKVQNNFIDIWGFYNGVSFDPDNITSQNANFDKGIIGALKKITYPTKGYTEMEYEANQVVRSGDFYDSCNPIYNVTENISIDSGDYPESNYCPDTESPIEKLITIPFAQVVSVTVNAATADAGVAYAALIKEGDTSPTYPESYTCDDEEGFPLSNIFSAYVFAEDDPPVDQIQEVITKKFNLGPGIYKLYVEVCGNGGQSTVAKARISYRTEPYQGEDANIDVGGVRVSRTIDTANMSGETIIKNYSYENEDNTLSSGILLNENPIFRSSVIAKNGYDGNCIEQTQYYNSLLLLASFQGSHILYKRVEEINLNESNGKIVHHFSGTSDTPYENFPTLRNNRNHKKGKLVHQEMLGVINGSFEIIQEEEREYNSFKLNSFSSIIDFESKLVLFRLGDGVEGCGGQEPLVTDYVFKGEEIFSEGYLLTSSEQTIDNVKSISTNEYDLENGLLKEALITNSKDEVLKTKYFYPKDITSIGDFGQPNILPNQYAALDRLKADDLHRTGVSIITETYNNDLKIASQRTTFIDKGNNQVLSESIQTAKGLDDFVERITYHEFDDKGNPLEVSKADGTKIVYIWGYHKQYPIAKLEAVQYFNVQNHVPNLQNLSNADVDADSENTLREALNNLRIQFPDGPMITTYTYDPLIGVTSITDPRGYTTYYEYDDFNRLKFVKDAEGNIVSKNEYNYKNN